MDTKAQRTFTTFAVLVNPDAPENFWSKPHIVRIGDLGCSEVRKRRWRRKPTRCAKTGLLFKVYHVTPTVGRYIRIIGDANAPVVQMAQFSAYGAFGRVTAKCFRLRH